MSSRLAKRVAFSDAWMGKADCQNCALRHSVLFSGLTESDFKEFHQPVDQIFLNSGEKLYGEGELGTHMFTIRKGLVKLEQYLPDGTQRIVRLLQSTDVAGLETLLNECYQHNAFALQATEICRYPTSDVIALSEHNPQLHRNLMMSWQSALSDADAWIIELSTGSAKLRVARLLLRLSKKNNDGKCTLFSREDMGAMLGITTETASRIIAEFKRQRLMKEAGSGQFYCDTLGLNEFISCGSTREVTGKP
jgi:CRP-like cAMP-binding protein